MSSLATDTGENQSAEPYDNDVIRSDWVGPIRLRQLRVSCQNSVDVDHNVDCVKAACINPTCTIFYLIATMEGKIFLGNVILSYFLVNMSSFLCKFYVILSLIGAHVVSMNCCSLWWLQCYFQWWSVTKYNYFVTVLKYIFQVSVLYWSSFILSNFYFYFTTFQSIRSYFLLHYIS